MMTWTEAGKGGNIPCPMVDRTLPMLRYFLFLLAAIAVLSVCANIASGQSLGKMRSQVRGRSAPAPPPKHDHDDHEHDEELGRKMEWKSK